jgi:hypothetical protein
MAIDNNIESLDGPFVTEKNQFYYPEGDKRIMVRPNRFYMVYYTKDKNITFVDSIYGNFIFPVFNKSPFLSYVNAKPGISREIYLKPYKLVLTKQMRKERSINRHFVKYIFDKYDRIFEVSGIRENINFYDSTSFRWQINGSKEQILLNNTKSLERAEKDLSGIQNLLNPLEFYEEEMTPYDEIQEKLGRLKFPPEPSTGGSGGGTGY